MSPPRQHDDEVSFPLTEAIRILAREAGFAAGKELLRVHKDNCDALKLLPEIRVALDDIKAVKRIRLWVHWVGGGICGGALFAFGEQLLNAAMRHF
jgi:hypothetical protein